MGEEQELTREEVVAWLKGFASALYRHALDQAGTETSRDLERHANSIYRAINTIQVIKVEPVETEEPEGALEEAGETSGDADETSEDAVETPEDGDD